MFNILFIVAGLIFLERSQTLYKDLKFRLANSLVLKCVIKQLTKKSSRNEYEINIFFREHCNCFLYNLFKIQVY